MLSVTVALATSMRTAINPDENQVSANNERLSFPAPVKNKQLSEDDLSECLRKKEKRGYEALYNMYAASLFGVILRIVQQRELAEDILLEAFMKIVSNADQYDSSRGRFFTWIVNIARHSAIDALRTRSYRNYKQNVDIESESLRLDKVHITAFNPAATDLKTLTDLLEPSHKRLIELAYFRGYTHSEIAQELEMPLGTVKTKIRLAIKVLRRVFNYSSTD